MNINFKHVLNHSFNSVGLPQKSVGINHISVSFAKINSDEMDVCL